MDGVAVVDGAIYSRFLGVVTRICCMCEVCRWHRALGLVEDDKVKEKRSQLQQMLDFA